MVFVHRLLRTRVARAALIVLVACTPAMNVHTAQSPSAQFERYRTFSLESDACMPADFAPSSQSTHVRQQVGQVTGAVLMAKGYTPASDEPADMAIRVSAGRREREIRWPVQVRPPWLVEDETEDFTEGAFVIDAFDTATDDLLWHGSARLEVQPGSVDEPLLRRAASAVLTSFPAR